MNVACVIQHHPARGHLVYGLLERLSPLPVEVVADPQPNSPFRSSWRSYYRCLEAFPDGASHVLVIQDDTTTVRDLAAALPAVIAGAQEFAGCDPLLALATFNELDSKQRVVLDRRFGTQPLQFVELRCSHHVPLVGTVWPRAARDALLAVAAPPYMGHGTQAGVQDPPLVRLEGGTYVFTEIVEDEIGDELGRLAIDDDELVYAHRDVLPPLVGTIPALVCHRGDVPSLIEPRTRRDRRTAMYPGDNFSALRVFL